MKFRNCCFTLNNYDDSEEKKLKESPFWRYLIVGKEVSETGTPHLQGYGVLDRPFTLQRFKKDICERAHVEQRKGSHKQARDYCKKDGDYYEVGEEPAQGKRTDLELAADIIKKTGSLKRVAEELPTTYTKYSRGLRDLSLMLIPPYEHDAVRGLWYVGPPGTGKSRKARSLYPDAYLKPQSKWFDGYDGQSVIILDDLDKGGTCLGHHLKIWTDRYPCTGETKGGTVQLRHTLFVVTSNYRIEELWSDDAIMAEAIKRRFVVTVFPQLPW